MRPLAWGAAGTGCGVGGFGGASSVAPGTLTGQAGALGGTGSCTGGGDVNSHGDPASTQGTRDQVSSVERRGTKPELVTAEARS